MATDGPGRRLEVDIVPFEQRAFTAVAGDTLIVEQTPDGLLVRHLGATGEREGTRDADDVTSATRAASTS